MEDIVSAARRTLNAVASLSEPHVMASVIATGYTMCDRWHVGRLRAIAAARLSQLGFKTALIARAFNQPWITTYNQIRSAPRLAAHPRYRRFFQDPDHPSPVDCGHCAPYGICPACHRGHGYAVLPPSLPSLP